MRDCGCRLSASCFGKDGCKFEEQNQRANVAVDRVVMLPDNTEDLLTGIHQEFYGNGLAHADAFRLLPAIIKRLKELGEIPAT